MSDLDEQVVRQLREVAATRFGYTKFDISSLAALAVSVIERLCAELAACEGPLPPWPITDAIDNRDLLDVLAHDDDIPEYRRNQARQAVDEFDRALSGVDAQ